MITVSFIVYAYNNETTIARSINSLKELKGTFKKDIIIIDDGSTDNTLKQIKAASLLIPKVIIISEARRGSAYCINKGTYLAQGEFICLLNGNEILHPESIIYLTSALQAQNADIAIGYRKNGINLNFFKLSKKKCKLIKEPIIEILEGKCDFKVDVSCGVSIIRKSLLEKIGKVNSDYFYANYSLSLKAAQATNIALIQQNVCFRENICNLDKKLYIYNALQSVYNFTYEYPDISSRYIPSLYKFLYRMIWSLNKTDFYLIYRFIKNLYGIQNKTLQYIQLLYKDELKRIR